MIVIILIINPFYIHWHNLVGQMGILQPNLIPVCRMGVSSVIFYNIWGFESFNIILLFYIWSNQSWLDPDPPSHSGIPLQTPIFQLLSCFVILNVICFNDIVTNQWLLRPCSAGLYLILFKLSVWFVAFSQIIWWRL